MPSYLAIPGIRGASLARRHEGAIELTSWTFGCSQVPPGGVGSGANIGPPQFTAVTFGCRGSQASPLLLEFCATSRQVAEVVCTQESGAGGSVTTEARFSDARVIGYSVIGDEDDRRDAFQLSFDRVTFTVHGQRPDGSLADPVTTTQPAAEPQAPPPPAPTPSSGGVWRPRGPLLPPR